MANRPPVRLDPLDSLPLSRRELLLSAGGARAGGNRWRAAAAARAHQHRWRHRQRRHAQARRHLPARRHRRRRRRTSSTARASSPSPTRPAWWRASRRCWSTTRSTSCRRQAATDGPRRGGHRRTSPTSGRSRCSDGIEFHNGKTLVGRRRDLLAAADPRPQGGAVRRRRPGLDRSQAIEKMDNLTVRLHAEGARLDHRRPARPVLQRHRAGRLQPHRAAQVRRHRPVHAESFTPGQQSVHKKNPNYWRTGQPYFDQVTIIDFGDPTAQVNALLAGQIDAMTDIPFAQIEVAKAARRPVDARGPGRRLAAAVHGRRHGAVRRRPRAPGDAADRRPPTRCSSRCCPATAASPTTSTRRSIAAYDTTLPQREHDLEQAKSLLKAGRPGGPHGRPAHHRRRRRHGRLGQRVRRSRRRPPASPSTSRTTPTTTATST